MESMTIVEHGNTPPQKTTIMLLANKISLRCLFMSFTLASGILLSLFSIQTLYHLNLHQEYALASMILCALTCGIALGQKTSSKPIINAHKWTVLLILIFGIGFHPFSLHLVSDLNQQFLSLKDSLVITFSIVTCLIPLVVGLTSTIVYHHIWHAPHQNKTYNSLLCISVFFITLFYGFYHLSAKATMLSPWSLPIISLGLMLCLLSFINQKTLSAKQWFELVLAICFVLLFNAGVSGLLQ